MANAGQRRKGRHRGVITLALSVMPSRDRGPRIGLPTKFPRSVSSWSGLRCIGSVIVCRMFHQLHIWWALLPLALHLQPTGTLVTELDAYEKTTWVRAVWPLRAHGWSATTLFSPSPSTSSSSLLIVFSHSFPTSPLFKKISPPLAAPQFKEVLISSFAS